MDVFDFDGTLYRGDSTARFYMYCVKRWPAVAATLPRVLAAAFRCIVVRRITVEQFKATLYGALLPALPSVEGAVRDFWRAEAARISGPCPIKSGDLVISAGPDFLLCPICEERDWRLICSRVDERTGELLSPNCIGEEKVRRFREDYPNADIMRFYSDSRKDTPLAHLAQEAFLVKDGCLQPWPW